MTFANGSDDVGNTKDRLEPMPTRRPDYRQPRSPASWRQRLRIAAATIGCFTIATLGGLVGLLIELVTLFRARRWTTEVLVRGIARIGLRLYGVRIVEHHCGPLPDRQTVFISNHSSSLDVPVIIALGLPNSRYFMSGFLRMIPPVALIGWLIGIFWTVPQKYPERRTKIFKDADHELRQTGESVFLTPEGQQTWRFNKGALHLATSLQAPLVPIYILIPNEVDPGPWDSGEFYAVRPGTVDVYYRPAIDTSSWTVADVPRNRDRIRALYVDWFTELHGGQRPPVEPDIPAPSSVSDTL